MKLLNMKPTLIINKRLQKPWLLISSYDVSFENYINIQSRVEKLRSKLNGKPDVNQKIQETVSHLQKQLQGISIHLRTLDEMIHNYIKSHQQ